MRCDVFATLNLTPLISIELLNLFPVNLRGKQAMKITQFIFKSITITVRNFLQKFTEVITIYKVVFKCFAQMLQSKALSPY